MTEANIPTADVAVVIPMFNAGRLAISAIESVMSQTVLVSDIVVIDDGSTDDSVRALSEAFAGRDLPLRVFQTANQGAAAARNFGMDKCTAGLIAFLDADDTWLPQKLERQLPVLHASTDIGMVGARTTMATTLADRQLDRFPPRTSITVRNLLFKNYFQTSTVLIRRSVVQAVGNFPGGQRHAEEGDFFIRAAAHSACILLNEVLVNYGQGKSGFGESGLSANLLGMEKGELRNIWRAWRRGDCGAALWLSATSFSLLKFCRRVVLRGIRQRHRSAGAEVAT